MSGSCCTFARLNRFTYIIIYMSVCGTMVPLNRRFVVYVRSLVNGVLQPTIRYMHTTAAFETANEYNSAEQLVYMLTTCNIDV